MKTINDLTEEQAIEIAKLLFPYIIVGEYEFRRSTGYNKTGNTEWYDYNDDCIIVNALYVDVHGQRRQLRCWILKNLDCRVDLWEPESGKIMRLPVRNQYVVQGLFKDMGIEPEYEMANDPEIDFYRTSTRT